MSDALGTDRWRGVTVTTFLGIGVGVLVKSPGLLLAGMVAVAYAALATGATPPSADLDVERRVSTSTPSPGEPVTVETTVRNVGDAALPDVRFVDGVPPGLEVVDGVARTYTALRSGESATFSYVVEAARGEHVFQPATAFVRDASGAVEREVTVEASGGTDHEMGASGGTDQEMGASGGAEQEPTAETGEAVEQESATDRGHRSITCVPRIEPVDSVPMRKLTSNLAGTVTSDVPGPGNEFHSIREYRSGDPLSRVDWNRFAETGELATVEYSAEQMATVVLVVDVRDRAFVETSADRPHAVEHCVDAARMLAGGLLDASNRVGVAGFGPDVSYLGPGLGRAHRARVRDFLATDLPRSPPEEDLFPRHLDELRRRLDGNLQVVWLSPLVDDYAVAVARKLVTDGHAVTAVSPNVTRTATPGHRLGRAERSLRLSRLREAGVRVVDWQPSGPLETAVVAAQRGWSG